MIIKSHKELAAAIEGKTILHLNSLGKDSSVCLEWLAHFAKPKAIHSVFFRRFTIHPLEEKFFDYQKRHYPSVNFYELPDPNELTAIIAGQFQEPQKRWLFNDFEYDGFSRSKMIQEMKILVGADLVCDGTAGYEGMGRAQKFHGGGLLQGATIYPLGLMKKKDIVKLIADLKIKINPTYRDYHSTFDELTYYRMRLALRRNPEFKKRVFSFFPLMKLDEYRWEKMINGQS